KEKKDRYKKSWCKPHGVPIYTSGNDLEIKKIDGMIGVSFENNFHPVCIMLSCKLKNKIYSGEWIRYVIEKEEWTYANGSTHLEGRVKQIISVPAEKTAYFNDINQKTVHKMEFKLIKD